MIKDIKDFKYCKFCGQSVYIMAYENHMICYHKKELNQEREK